MHKRFSYQFVGDNLIEILYPGPTPTPLKIIIFCWVRLYWKNVSPAELGHIRSGNGLARLELPVGFSDKETRMTTSINSEAL